MISVNQTAQETLDILTEGLSGSQGNDSRVIDNKPNGYMAVTVEFVRTELKYGGARYSVGHYYTQNGDLMRDPEMEFIKTEDGNYFPVYFRQDGVFARSEESLEIKNGKYRIIVGLQAAHVKFANLWLRNIKNQQNLKMNTEVSQCNAGLTVREYIEKHKERFWDTFGKSLEDFMSILAIMGIPDFDIVKFDKYLHKTGYSEEQHGSMSDYVNERYGKKAKELFEELISTQ